MGNFEIGPTAPDAKRHSKADMNDREHKPTTGSTSQRRSRKRDRWECDKQPCWRATGGRCEQRRERPSGRTRRRREKQRAVNRHRNPTSIDPVWLLRQNLDFQPHFNNFIRHSGRRLDPLEKKRNKETILQQFWTATFIWQENDYVLFCWIFNFFIKSHNESMCRTRMSKIPHRLLQMFISGLHTLGYPKTFPCRNKTAHLTICYNPHANTTIQKHLCVSVLQKLMLCWTQDRFGRLTKRKSQPFLEWIPGFFCNCLVEESVMSQRAYRPKCFAHVLREPYCVCVYVGGPFCY